jgi:hypothetical protein
MSAAQEILNKVDTWKIPDDEKKRLKEELTQYLAKRSERIMNERKGGIQYV